MHIHIGTVHSGGELRRSCTRAIQLEKKEIETQNKVRTVNHYQAWPFKYGWWELK